MHLHQDPAIPPLLPTITPQISQPNHDQNDQGSSTKPKHLYFAYGSNLSPTQMRIRCTVNPALSAHPVAIAALDGWRWLICQFGYANVVPPEGLRVGPQTVEGNAVPESSSGTVFGILYEMDEKDEEILDGYEGVDICSPLSRYGSTSDLSPKEGGVHVPASIRPREQDGFYNKWYVNARVLRWLDEEYRERIGFEGEGGEVRVLVYVDELRVRVANPKEEYIPRMNRAIREAVGLGFPEDWAEEVMRPSIPLEELN